MNNAQIRQIMKKNHIFSWQVAKVLGIHEGTFSRWFREPLTQEQEQQILMAVESIKLSRIKEEDNK